MKILSKMFLIALMPLLLFFSGCSYMRSLKSQKKAQVLYAISPSLKKLKRSAPEDTRVFIGHIANRRKILQDVPILAAASGNSYGKDEIVDMRIVNRNGTFSLYLPESIYQILFFADFNNDGTFSSDEGIRIAAGKVVFTLDKNIEDLSTKSSDTINIYKISEDRIEIPIEAPLNSPEEPGQVVVEDSTAMGKYSDLSDPVFSPDNGKLGFYDPHEFLRRINYWFYLPVDDSPEKTTIIFVHGASGTPANWEYIISKLDRTKFTPIVFYYPSGLRLDFLSKTLFEALKHTSQTREKIILVGHSMGGLVCRGALKHYSKERSRDYIPLYISLSTPYGGNEAAAAGVKSAPLVIPCWRDLDSSSPFIKNIANPSLPETTTFYLFFSYLNMGRSRAGKQSDGVIELKSQLEPRMQKSAERIVGFNETHMSILTSEDVSNHINTLLSKHSQ